jgi:hypothetical protein
LFAENPVVVKALDQVRTALILLAMEDQEHFAIVRKW